MDFSIILGYNIGFSIRVQLSTTIFDFLPALVSSSRVGFITSPAIAIKIPEAYKRFQSNLK